MPSEGLGGHAAWCLPFEGFPLLPTFWPHIRLCPWGRGTNCVSGPRWLLERVTSPACASVVSSVEWG